MSIQVDYATIAALSRVQKVIRSKIATVISTRPTDTTGFFDDLDGDAVAQHLPTPSIRLSPVELVPYVVNDDVVAFVYHNNDRTEGIRTSGGPTYYVEQGSELTIGVYVRILFSDGAASTGREQPSGLGGLMTGFEENYFRAELYAGAIEYALMKWGQGGGEIYDIRRTSVEVGIEREPQRHSYARIEFRVAQDLEIPVNTYDLA